MTHPTSRRRAQRRLRFFEQLEDRRVMAVDLKLVRDLWASETTTNPTSFVEMGGSLFFAEASPETGTELWRTDGTPAGTQLVADIRSGIAGSNPTQLFNHNGTLFFQADDGVHGLELWRSDGTAAGTRLVADINPGPANSSVATDRDFTSFDGDLFFTAIDATDGWELWRTDGTTEGTSRVSDVRSGSDPSRVYGLFNGGGKLFFTANPAGDSYPQNELFATDGTPQGTTQLTFPLGTANTNPGHLVELDGITYFAGNGPAAYGQLWRTDGTVEGTHVIAAAPGGDALRGVSELTVFNGSLYFQGWGGGEGRELWSSDGTVEGTRLLDLAGADDSMPHNFSVVGNQLFFVASTFATGNELWVSDGTVAGSRMVVELSSGRDSSSVGKVVDLDGKLLFFKFDTSSAKTLYTTDGTAAGTTQVLSGSFDGTMLRFGDSLILRQLIGGTRSRLVKTDGSGTQPFYEGTSALGSSPTRLTNVDDRLFLNTDSQAWQLDPVTGLPKVGLPGDANGRGKSFVDIMTVDGKTFYTENRFGELSLFITDGTVVGTQRLSAALTGNPRLFAGFDGRVFFTTGNNGEGLWTSDGTVDGTRKVADIRPGELDLIASLIAVGDTLYFSASDGVNGQELWKSDGTEEGTQLVADIREGSPGSTPQYLTNVNGTLYFAADDGVHGMELWTSDGTSAGTVRLSDIAVGADGSALKSLTNLSGALYFQANDGTTGAEPWRLDPVLGAVQVADIASGPASSNPRDFVAAGGVQFFVADNGSSGVELYTTDGTPLGTTQIEIRAGASSSNPLFLTQFKGQLYFQADDGVHGEELWTSDGTAAGTQIVEDLGLAGGSAPQELTVVGDILYFSAITNATGRELFRTADPANAPHLVTPSSAIYSEHDDPVAVSPGGLIWDWDSPDFADGSLTASISNGLDAGTDVLSLLEVGGITLSGAVVLHQGLAIGAVSGGTAGAPLIVSFNGNATPAAAQAVLRAIGFSATGDNLAANSRAVSFSLDDADGAGPVTDIAVVVVRLEEDPPVLILSGDPPAVLEDAGPQTVNGFVTNVSPAGSTFEIIGNSNPALFAILPVIDASGVLTYRPAADAFGTAQITVRAVSGGVPSDPVVFTIEVRSVNDVPVIVINNSAEFVEDGPAVLLVADVEIRDVDSQFSRFRVDVLSSTTDDVLSIRNEGLGAGQIGYDGLQVTYGGEPITTSVWDYGDRLEFILNSNATAESLRALSRSITFRNTGDRPSTASRSVAFNVMDDRGEWNSVAGVVALTMIPVDDPFSVTFRGTSNAIENQSHQLDYQARVTDPDASDFRNGAVRVTISADAMPADAIWIETTGVISLAGNQILFRGDVIGTWSGGTAGMPLEVVFNDQATLSATQGVLAALKFQTNEDAPLPTRQLTIELTDGNGVQRQITHTVIVNAVDDLPLFRVVEPSTVRENGPAVLVAPNVELYDPDSLDYPAGTLLFGPENAFSAMFVVGIRHQGNAAGEIGVDGNTVSYGGTAFGTIRSSEGRVGALDFFAQAPREAIQAFVRNLTIRAVGESIPTTTMEFEFFFDIKDPNRQPRRSEIPLQAVGHNDRPKFGTVTRAHEYLENDPPLRFFTSFVQDPDPGPQFDNARATISILENAEPGDVLTVSMAGTRTYVVNGTGIFLSDGRQVATLSGGVNGEPLIIEFGETIPRIFVDHILQGLVFSTTSDTDPGLTRTIELVLTDGGGASSNPLLFSVHVTEANDAPILDNSLNPTLPAIAEDVPNLAGTQVNALLKNAVSDGDAAALRGIAVTAASNFYGTWQYTINGGSTWVGMNEPSSASALLLPGWARVRFLPNANFHGQVKLWYTAWDQTAGTTGGTLNVTGNNAGGSKSVSTAVENASLTITPVNDAPVLNTAANPTLPSVAKNATNPAGTLVSSLLAGAVSDADSGALRAIAVTAASDFNGTWQFSTNGGATWQSLGQPTGSAARLLAGWVRIRFVPKPNFVGTVKLYYYAWDQTQGTNGGMLNTTGNTGGSKSLSTALESASLTVI